VDSFGYRYLYGNREIPALTGRGYNPWRKPGDRTVHWPCAIVEEVPRENVSLLSETAWTLPDIASVNEAFDREYDQEEYERKITGLIRGVLANAQANARYRWAEAVSTIGKEDHYLLVMIAAAGA
jgi:hypothetical protein